jgi:hypothetical protein
MGMGYNSGANWIVGPSPERAKDSWRSRIRPPYIDSAFDDISHWHSDSACVMLMTF